MSDDCSLTLRPAPTINLTTATPGALAIDLKIAATIARDIDLPESLRVIHDDADAF